MSSAVQIVKPNTADMRRMLAALFPRGGVVELRCPDHPRTNTTTAGYFNDFKKLVNEAARLSGQCPGVYITLNEVNPALLARINNRLEQYAKQTTSDGADNILRRRWLLVDIDPKRPSGISANDTERAAAQQAREEIRGWLSGAGWPMPVEADSGNGAYLLYKIDLANNDGARELVKNCLKALAWRFDSAEVSVDTSCFNASRIAKLIGTLAGKGDGDSERQHHLSRLLAVPDPVCLVPVDLLEALARQIPPPPPKTHHNNGFDLEEWIARHGLPVAFSGPWEKGRRWILNPCPWNDAHTNRSAYIVQFSNGAIAAGCHHNGCQGSDWHALRDLVEPGWRDHHGNDTFTSQNRFGSGFDHARDGQALTSPRRGSAPFVETFSATDLMAMELPEPCWAVRGVISEGLNFLAGKPKLGKSWLALALACAIASGGVALGKIEVEAGDVLYLALEDTKRRLKARLQKMLGRQEAAPPPRLTLSCCWPRQDEGGLEAIGQWLDARQGGARLVIVDTWPKFRPRLKGKGDRYAEDYEHAAALKEFFDCRNVAGLALAHCRKLGAEDPLEEMTGTLGLAGAADTVLILRRERGKHDAAIFTTGRDVDEQELALSWDARYCLWSLLGDAAEYRLSKEREEVLQLFRREQRALQAKEVAELIDKDRRAVRKLLAAMAQDGQLRAEKGGVYLLSHTSGNSGNSGNRGLFPDEDESAQGQAY